MKTDKKPVYQTPRVTTYTAEAIVKQIGPAQAGYGPLP